MIKAVIFDVDGVLVHPDYSLFIHGRKAIRNFLKKYNINVKIESPFFKSVYDTIYSKFDPLVAKKLYLKASEIATKYELLSLTKMIIEEDAQETIRVLRSKGYKVGIFSLSGRKYVMEVLRRLKVENDVNVVITREDCKPKPYPEGIYKACKKLGLNPNEIVYIGDHTIDIDTARNANCAIIYYQKRKSNEIVFRAQRILTISKISPDEILRAIYKLERL